jgi:hypothetical protein
MSVDPSHYLAASNDGKPPLLKLINIAARPELNNQFGQAISYSAGRYVVAVLDGASVTAAAATTTTTNTTSTNSTFVKLKPENLIEATNIDQLRFGIQMIYTTCKATITNTEYHNYYGSLIITKLKISPSIQQKLKLTPTNALLITCIIVLCFIITCVIILGNLLGSYHRLFILTSLVVLFIIITSPDWTAGYKSNKSIGHICKSCITNFHQRWKDNLINITGYNNTFITNNVAWAVLFIVLLVAGKSLLSPPTSFTAPSSPLLHMPQQTQSSIDIEYIYKLGYDDAKAGNEYQSSLLKEIVLQQQQHQQQPTTRRLGTDKDEEEMDQYNNYNANDDWRPPPPPSNKSSSSFGISTVMSAFTLYKFGKDIITTPSGQLIFDVQIILHKLKSVEPWRLGLLGLSVYRVMLALRSFF